MVADPVLAIVLPTVTVVFLAIIALIMSCCKFQLITSLQRAYWRHNNAKKSRNGVFTVDTSEDQGSLIANRIYKPGVGKPKHLNPADNDTHPVSPQKDNTHLLDDDAVMSETHREMVSPVTKIVRPHVNDDMVSPVEDHVECMSNSEGLNLVTAEVHNAGPGDFESEIGDDDETSLYMPMDRPLRGIRGCGTFCRAPSEPYSNRDSMDSLSAFLSKPELCGPGRSSTYISARTVPVARCTPFRTKEDVQKESMTDHDEKAKAINPVSLRYSGKFVPRLFPSPLICMPRKVYRENFRQDLSLSDSCDDLFKEAWWRSSLSIDGDSLLKEQTKPPPLHARDPPSRQSSYAGSIYVQMELETARRPPSLEGRRGRSFTMPNAFERRPRDPFSPSMSPQCVSVWYPPHLPGNLQFTAELRPGPRPCFAVPHYINFKGTLPVKL